MKLEKRCTELENRCKALEVKYVALQVVFESHTKTLTNFIDKQIKHTTRERKFNRRMLSIGMGVVLVVSVIRLFWG